MHPKGYSTSEGPKDTPLHRTKHELIPCHRLDIVGKFFICALKNHRVDEVLSSSIIEDTVSYEEQYLHQFDIND